MLFISLGKYRRKPTKQSLAENYKNLEKLAQKGVKFKAVYWTLGRHDSIAIWEAPDEKVAMKTMIDAFDWIASETLTVVPREEVAKLLE